MFRSLFCTIAICCFAGTIHANEAVNKRTLPKPFDFIRCDQTVWEAGGHFELIDVRFDPQAGEQVKGAGIVWTLQAKRPVPCDVANDFLKNYKECVFYKQIRKAKIQVGTRLIMTPDVVANGAIFQGIFGRVLQKGEAIEVWTYIDQNIATQLRQDGATLMLLRPLQPFGF